MRRSLLWTGLGAIVLALTVTSAHAQEGQVPEIDEGTSIVTGFLAGQFFDFTNNFEDFNNEVNNKLGWGLRYQYQLTQRFGLEGTLLFSPVSHDLFTPTGDVIGERKFDSSYYTANGVWNFRRSGRLFPFITGGMGGVSLSVDDPNLEETETNLLWNFGGGVMYAAHEKIMLRVELRDYIYNMSDVDADFRQALLLPVDFDETISDLSLTFGASYVF